MNSLGTKVLLLIPLLTLSTGLLGPDILLSVEKIATSDHVGTDFCGTPVATGSIHCVPIRAQVNWGFAGGISGIDTVLACLIHFSGPLPGSANGIAFCKVTDQDGIDVAIGGAAVAPFDATTGQGCVGLATAADPATGVGVGDIVASTTCFLRLDTDLATAGNQPVDIQEVDDVKVIVLGPFVSP